MTDCIFCKIVNKEIASDLIYEDDSILILKDIHPLAPVHYLAIPKEHILSIMQLRDNHGEIISKMIFAMKRMAEKLGLSGYKLIFNVGREGGQIIDHLHLHLMGGWGQEEDIIKTPHPSLDK